MKIDETQHLYAFEKTLSALARIQGGQFYTPSELCDVMLAMLRLKPGERLLEPGCGAGAFLVRALHKLTFQYQELPSCALAQLHGVEENPEASEMARMMLSQSVNSSGAVPTIWTGNFLEASEAKLGQFDAIIGNPPYVRQEHVRQSETLDKTASLSALQEAYSDYLAAYPAQRALFSQQADLYLGFFLKATTLLKPRGRLAFVTSNSWLNTRFGQPFRQFLTHWFQVQVLAESACERWFPDVAVNAVIVVLEKRARWLRPDELSLSNETLCLLRFLQPLTQCVPSPTVENYWPLLHESLLQPQSSAQCSVQTLLVSRLQVEPLQSNWALALRGPGILMRWLQDPQLWQPLESLGQVRYPLKTGINRFFYLNKLQAEHWRIEPEFLRPVARSSRAIHFWQLNAMDCDTLLFTCDQSKEALQAQGKTGALHYITWGETQLAPARQKRSAPVPWPQVVSVRGNKYWYQARALEPPHLLCNRFLDQRFFFAICQGELSEDQTFYGVTFNDAESGRVAFWAGLLNSTLSFLALEFLARSSLGEGVLQYARCDMAAFPVLTTSLYQVDEQAAIAEAFHQMAQRPILPLSQELHQPDRHALDALVLKPLLSRLAPEFTESDLPVFREQLVQQLLQRVTERVQTAKSAKRRKTPYGNAKTK